MTPQERQLVNDLFERLASLENSPRDPDAERQITDGLARAPHAIYPLVQTVLLQDEALRRANDRIRELEGGAPAHESPGFLDSLRDAFIGRDDARRGSVPSVPPASKWGSGQTLGGGQFGTQQQSGGFPPPLPQQPEPQRGGGSFLGTAAAAAAGVIGGSLLLNSIQGKMGGHGGQALASPGGDKNPWGGNNDASRSDMARDAGVGDVGNSGRGGDDRGQGLFGNQQDSGNDASWDGGDDDFADADFGDFGE